MIQLGGKMALLGELRILERLIGRFEIGAGILPVAIEEEIVQRAGEIVVMGNVLLGGADRVVLVETLQGDARLVEELEDCRARPALEISQEQFEHLIDGALLQFEAARHVGLAQIAIRIEGDPLFPLRIGHAKCQGRSGAVAIGIGLAGRVGDLQRASLDHIFQYAIE